MTVEEFARMETGETEDYELVDGALVPLSSPTPRHCTVCDFITYRFRAYFEQKPAGKVISEVDCRISDHRVRQPDVSIFLGEHARQTDPNKIPIPFAPDLAVEVLSDSESSIKTNRKVCDYLGAGSREVRVVDHVNSELFVYSGNSVRLLLTGDVPESPLLPGFSIPVDDVFAG